MFQGSLAVWGLGLTIGSESDEAPNRQQRLWLPSTSHSASLKSGCSLQLHGTPSRRKLEHGFRRVSGFGV